MKIKKKIDLLDSLSNYHKIHEVLMKNLHTICRKVISEYNKNMFERMKIDYCRIHLSRFYPDEKKINIDIQIWIKNGYSLMQEEEVISIEKVFGKILNRHLVYRREFEFDIYVQNTAVPSEDD